MKYYPICLQVTDKKCIVVGGGEVAERKVKRLVECGARVVVVGKILTPFLKAMTGEGRIEHIDADYDEAYIHDAFLVIGATDRDEVNERICGEARERKILVNIVDDPARCDFILPSLFQRGDLLLAISTGGKSPALARKLREELEGHYGPEYATLLTILGKLREKIVVGGRPSEEKRRLFTAIVNSDILQHIKEKNWDCVEKVIHDIVGVDIDL
ncbi:MAG: bifunctional precorrin-2 dehydrogenase/sirohydrochlorin ferrochelatase [Syntrophales bacterium]|nr:bifunctional precorrin-2 dehydrogenase/sirohydrochlorin ferrochelatase [Syntrophales bacterium]